MKDWRKSATGRVVLIGHRGACGRAPENTMFSFQRALEFGVDAVELDVHMTADQQVVVIHDFNLERTTDGTGYVRDLTLAELKELDAGSWYADAHRGLRIPTLAEVLAWAHDRVWLLIEIKSERITYPGIERAVAELLRQYDMVDQVLVISFDHLCLREIKNLEPQVATGPLYGGRLVDPGAVARLTGADVMRPHWRYATSADVQNLHAQGLGYMPWGANDLEVWRWLLSLDVDGLSADDPETLRELLDASV